MNLVFISLNRNPWMEILALVCVISLVACGGSDGDTNGNDLSRDEKTLNPIGDWPDISAWTRPRDVYNFEEFSEVGWKQRQVYDVHILPLALEARYGFF